jgi:hypothetical protein
MVNLIIDGKVSLVFLSLFASANRNELIVCFI